jgi:hypothetical protein
MSPCKGERLLTADRCFFPRVKVCIMVARSDNSYQDDFRPELVARVRREIQQGTYETLEKFELAFERMLYEIREEEE